MRASRLVSLPAPDPSSVVLVTGASAGIGEELARQLGARGHNLILVARRKARLDKLAAEIREASGVTVGVRECDLGVPTPRGRLIEELKGGDRFIDGVVNNAGYGSFGRFHELDLDAEKQMVQLNVAALHEITGAFLPEMVRRGTGAILNVGSIAGIQPMFRNATYAGTKAFVNTFSESVHADLAGTGVSCTALEPGPVATEFADVAGIGGAMDSPFARFAATAEDVARAGVDGMVKGRRVVTPGLIAKIASGGGRLAPRSLYLPLSRVIPK